jgi:hypothetical protein
VQDLPLLPRQRWCQDTKAAVLTVSMAAQRTTRTAPLNADDDEEEAEGESGGAQEAVQGVVSSRHGGIAASREEKRGDGRRFRRPGASR